MDDRKAARQRRLAESKRQHILDAAREAFAEDGLEKASLRAIATKAGYTPAALYFHFPSKEAIYAELLRSSLASLGESVAAAVTGADTAEARFRAAGMAFFGYYAANPSELDLGFYLFRGGMKPAGLDRETELALFADFPDALAGRTVLLATHASLPETTPFKKLALTGGRLREIGQPQ